MPETLQDITELENSGNKSVVIKIKKLFLDLAEHPATGTGQIEVLRGNLPGYRSRRIDKLNRLTDKTEEEIRMVVVVAAKGFYGRK